MKKKWLFFPVLTIIFIFTVLPLGYLNANPSNLVTNGDFSDGSNHWFLYSSSIVGGEALVGPINGAYVYQVDINASNKNIKYSVDVKPVTYNSLGSFDVAFRLIKGGTGLGDRTSNYNSLPTGKWSHISFKISDAWPSIPDFDKMEIWIQTFGGCQVYCDNFSLKAPGSTKEAVEEGFIRTMPMTCYQVWVNSDNKFEMVFWYPYADNNWVKIYDMSGKEVYSVDMPLDDPHIIVDLPNGMYTVKTFNDQPEPLQTFIIGK
jgi:hypothetical protein